jgi:hypothetical protein
MQESVYYNFTGTSKWQLIESYQEEVLKLYMSFTIKSQDEVVKRSFDPGTRWQFELGG